jgi:hypothetical protein
MVLVKRLGACVAALISGAALFSACGSDGDGGSGGAKNDGGVIDGLADVHYDAIAVPGSQCNAVRQQHPTEASPHVDECSVLSFTTNPPSSGPHYGVWAAYEIYSVPVPMGYLVHAMEHGAVVVLYNCSDDCSAEVAQAETWANTLPPDPLCATNSAKRRVIVSPDPKLLTKWAAAAWGATLRTSCFEADVFTEFYDLFYAKAPENFCTDGADLKNGDGGLIVPASCGEGDGGSFDSGGPIMDGGSD